MQTRTVQPRDRHTPPPLRLVGGGERPVFERTYPGVTGYLLVVRVFPGRLLAVPGGCGACPLARCNLSGQPGTDLAVCLQPIEDA